jgi:hypothetical protein
VEGGVTNLKLSQIIVIGAAIVFGLPIIVGLVVGHFFGLWLGVTSGGIVLLFVLFIVRRQLMKRAREQEKPLGTEDKSDG